MHDPYLDPRLRPHTIDRYVHRRSILRALRASLPEIRGRVLDVGCGEMPYRPLLTTSAQVAEYVGLDLQSNRLYRQAPDVTWDGRTIPLGDAGFDSAIATEVLEHCSDPASVLTEICRVLKPGASLFFTVPFLWPLHDVPYDEYRYTPFALERLVLAAGFRECALRGTGGWNASLAQMAGLWVRRSPLPRVARVAASLAAIPLIWTLLKCDRAPAAPFPEGVMITGVAGIARK